MMKIKLHFRKATAISIFIFLFILSIFLASAIEFEFSSPEEGKLNESIEIEITTMEENTNNYDVKIFVSENAKTISQIFDESTEKWKNSFNYLKETFPEKKDYEIKVLQTGNFELCVKLRLSGSNSKIYEKCSQIKIMEGDEADEAEEPEEKESVEENDSSDEVQEENSETISKSHINQIEIEKQNEKIILSSPSASNFTTKEEKIRVFLFIAFCVLLVFILILLIFRKI